MRIALVMMVKNEQAMLRRNLLFHRLMGVDRMYIYLDGCTDDTAACVSDLPEVMVRETVGPEDVPDPALDTYHEKVEQSVARQCLNVAHAAQRAADEGIDWLLHIDADEFTCPGPMTVVSGGLRTLLDQQHDEVECVRFLPHEMCVRKVNYSDALCEETLFVRPNARGRRRIFDPISHEYFTARLALGHEKGKCAFRPRADLLPKGPHRFLHRDQSPAREVTAGLLAHFYLTGFDDYLAKFKRFAQRPDFALNGAPIRRQIRIWRDMVNHPDQFSEDELRAYFARWIVMPKRVLRRHRRAHRLFGGRVLCSPLMEISTVRDAFTQHLEEKPKPAVQTLIAPEQPNQVHLAPRLRPSETIRRTPPHRRSRSGISHSDTDASKIRFATSPKSDGGSTSSSEGA